MVCGLGFGISGFGFRFSVFGSRVSGLEFPVSGFGFRDKGCTPPKAVPSHWRPVTSWKGRVAISCPDPATPITTLLPHLYFEMSGHFRNFNVELGTWYFGAVRVRLGTSLLRNLPPHPRTTIGLWAQSYCRVLRGGGFLLARYPCTRRLLRRERGPTTRRLQF